MPNIGSKRFKANYQAPVQKKYVTIKLKKLHPAQELIFSEKSRFNVVCCGRRFGKTSLAVEVLASPDDKSNGFMHGWPMAYFCPTYKMLQEVWREILDTFEGIISGKSETEKRIVFDGGGSVDFWSLEDPNSVRGRKYKGIVLDEFAMARNAEEAWNKVLRATLTDLIGTAWFLSTPKGKNNFFYKLSKNIDLFADWRFWQFPTEANPHISKDEIEQARLQLDPLTFAQEYLASFITENLDAWAYCYDPKKHIGKTVLNASHEVYLSFDFNRNPITCGVWQHYGSSFKPTIRALEQIKLPNSNIYNLCDHILAKYAGRMLIVTGDATGSASTAMVQDNLNYYTIIRSKLKLNSGQMKVPMSNPVVKENRVLVNSIFYNHDVLIDPDNCKGLIFDLEHARTMPDGSLEKMDRKDPAQQQDCMDTMRYYYTTFHKNLLKL